MVFFKFLFYKINKPVKNRKDTLIIKPSPTYRGCKSRFFFVFFLEIPEQHNEGTEQLVLNTVNNYILKLLLIDITLVFQIVWDLHKVLDIGTSLCASLDIETVTLFLRTR